MSSIPNLPIRVSLKRKEKFKTNPQYKMKYWNHKFQPKNINSSSKLLYFSIIIPSLSVFICNTKKYYY